MRVTGPSKRELPTPMLSNAVISGAKPREKAFKLADGGGLYLLVTPAGSRWWRLRFRVRGTEKMLSLGTFPDVSLKLARERRDQARRDLANGIDPGAKRRTEKMASGNTFEAIAREWFDKFSPSWAPGYSSKVIRRLEICVFPWMGSMPIAQIKAPDLLACLRRVEARGKLGTAHRALQVCGRVFRYAVATGRAERDPSGDLRGALPPKQEKHHASFTDPRSLAGLLRAIDAYDGSNVVRSALRLAPLVFVRPGELRAAEWKEFNLGAGEWRIGAERMKMRVQHIVPLSRQAVAILREMEPVTGAGRFVFPSPRSDTRPLSDNGMLAALRRMGFERGVLTVHGFRSTASTLLNEQGWNPDAIERQLAHSERDGVRAAYNYAEYLPERRKMMQAWADYIDSLKVDAQSTRLPQGKSDERQEATDSRDMRAEAGWAHG
jgi:integrase